MYIVREHDFRKDLREHKMLEDLKLQHEQRVPVAALSRYLNKYPNSRSLLGVDGRLWMTKELRNEDLRDVVAAEDRKLASLLQAQQQKNQI